MRTRPVSILCILLFASIGAAHAAVLGPELPITAPDTSSAPFEQGAPDVASTGTSALAVWLDARGSVPALAPRYAAYATMLDEHGVPLTPNGIEIARNAYAVKVATNGSEFLIVYGTTTDGRLYAVRTLDGAPATEPVFIGDGTIVSLASNGNTYCAIVADYGFSQFTAVILGSDAWPIVTVPLADAIDAVIAVNGGYIAVGSSARTVAATRISESGNTARNVIASNRPDTLRTAIAAGDNGALVAWTGESENDGRVTEAVTIDNDGRKNGATRTIYTTEELAFIGSDLAPSIAFDGARYLVGFAVPTTYAPLRSYYLASRVSESGELLDEHPVALSGAMESGFVAAEIDHDMLLVWSELGDVRARTMNNFLSVDLSPEPDVVVSRAPDVQSETSLAISGGVGFAAWVEGDSADKIMATFFTPPSATTNAPVRDAKPVTLAGYGNVTYAAPSVAAAGDRFIAVWRESFDDETRVYAQRWSADGAKVDGEPLLLDVTSGSAYDFMTDTAVASDGTSFLAVWRHGGDVYGAVIPRGGDVRTAFRVSRTSANTHARVSPSIAWTGAMYLVAWAHQDGVFLARVSADGTLLDTTSSRLIGPASDSVAIAMGATRALAVSSAGNCVQGAVLSNDGQVVSSVAPFGCDSVEGRNDVAVTWNGDAFVAAWSHETLEGARVDESGALVERFTLAGDAWSPALAPGVVAYAHVSGDGTGRIVARTFKGGNPKRRSAGR